MIYYLETNLHGMSFSRFRAFIANDHSEIETLSASVLKFEEENLLFKFEESNIKLTISFYIS
jgi:hypothetical protein